MAKVITISQTFPSYHVQAGHPSNFVAKIWTALNLRIWTGKPYCSKQLEIALVKVVQTYKFRIVHRNSLSSIYLDEVECRIDLETLAKNDGLEVEDFASWFRFGTAQDFDFEGQIICWKFPHY
ncbi:MAG TPA: hypothetical protein PKY82_34975 [Pyrinomonadaceae bacterium]|nr:hypothetical protein [Pyrinomonadaceae bacterium]